MPVFTTIGGAILGTSGAIAAGAGTAAGASAAATAATVGAAAVGAGAAAAGVGLSAVSALQGQQAQQDAMRQQKKAQQAATAKAIGQQRQSEMVTNAANRRTPDINSIMSAASQAAKTGPSSTMLTGPGGVDPNSLALGRSSLLGG